MEWLRSSQALNALILGLALVVAGPSWGAKGEADINRNAPQGGTLQFSLDSEPPTFNPFSATDNSSLTITGLLFASLLRTNLDTYGWEPYVAESWNISEDGKTFTFKIHKSAQFSDGKPITAEDVKFSFDAVFDDKYEASHKRPYFEGIKEVKVVDKNTVQFITKEKYFRNFSTAAAMVRIVPKHYYGDVSKKKKWKRKPIGSGPFIIDKFEKGRRLVLVKNPKWWGDQIPDFKGIFNFKRYSYRYIKENTIALENLKKGTIDTMSMSPEVFVKHATGPKFENGDVIKVKMQNESPKGYGFIGWNLKNPKFQDRKVRVALAHLMNRDLMNKKFRFGMSVLATGPWYVQSRYASKNVKPILFDVKKAIQLFKEAGWTDSDKNGILDKKINGKKEEFRFTLLTASKDMMKYFTMYKEDAKKAGVEVEIKLMEWNAFLKFMDERKFEALALGWGGGGVHRDPKQIWHSESTRAGGSNFIEYSNKEVDKLIDEARATMDHSKREPIMKKIYELIAHDAPYLFMFNDKYGLYGVRKNIGRPKDTFAYDLGDSFWWLAK